MSLRSQILVNKQALPTAEQALPGRSTAMPVPPAHHVNGNPLQPPFPAGLQQAVFGMGCFWGAERRFWEQPGVWTTAVGYAGGITPNPTYDEVCSGLTGHTEAVLVVFDPKVIDYETLLRIFGRHTTRPRVCVRAMMSAVSTGRRSTAWTRSSAARPKPVVSAFSSA